MTTALDHVAEEGYGQKIADQTQNTPNAILEGTDYQVGEDGQIQFGDYLPSGLVSEEFLKRLVNSGQMQYFPGEEPIDPGMDVQPGRYGMKLSNGLYQGAIKVGDNWMLGDPKEPSGGGLGHFLRNFVLPATLLGGASLAGIGQGATQAAVQSPNAVLANTAANNAISNFAPGAVASAAGGVGAAGAAGAAAGVGGVLSNPAVLAAALGTAGNAYVANQAGSALRQGYQEDEAWRQQYRDRLDESYTNPSGYLNSPEYTAQQNIVHNKLQRSDAAAGVLGNDAMRQKLLQDHALASLEQHRNGIRSSLGLVNPNVNQYAQGIGMNANIMAPVLDYLGRQAAPKPGVSVNQDGRLEVVWG